MGVFSDVTRYKINTQKPSGFLCTSIKQDMGRSHRELWGVVLQECGLWWSDLLTLGDPVGAPGSRPLALLCSQSLFLLPP